MPVAVSFIVGFILAQIGWWVAARDTVASGDALALSGAPTFRFLMLAGVEILVAAVAFAAMVALISRSRLVAPSAKSCFVAFIAGATTSTIAAGPYALIPRILPGEAQLIVWVAVAAVVSALFGALVALAFRQPNGESS